VRTGRETQICPRFSMSPPLDPRAAALAAFLRTRASLYSLSADVNNSPRIAEAGMALLEAAAIAEQLGSRDPLLVRLSEAGMFESMPNQEATVVSTPEIDRILQRPIAGGSRDGLTILGELAQAVEPRSSQG
jgi:hypothetical protein